MWRRSQGKVTSYLMRGLLMKEYWARMGGDKNKDVIIPPSPDDHASLVADRLKLLIKNTHSYENK